MSCKTSSLFLAFCLVACGSGVQPFADPSEEYGESVSALSEVQRYTYRPQSETDLCLAIEGGQETDGSAVVLQACNNGNEQLWARFGSTIQSFGGKCLQPHGGADANGTALVLGACSEAAASSFGFTQSQFTWGAASGKTKCLDVTDGAFKAGTAIQLWDCSAEGTNGHQMFYVLRAAASQQKAAGNANEHKASDTATAAPASAGHTAAASEANHVTASATAAAATNHNATATAASHPTTSTTSSSATAPKASTASESHASTTTSSAPKTSTSSAATSTTKSSTTSTTSTTSTAAASTTGTNTYGPTPAGVLVAPYFWNWGSSTGFAKTLSEIKSNGGVKAATLAFALSNGGCNVNGFSSMASDIKAFEQAGGTVILSFGGADGTYLQKTCQTTSSLAQALLTQMSTYNTNFIDFDVEGTNLNDTASINALIAALASVQQQNSKASISFTLPVDPSSGLPSTAVTLLKTAAQKGVRVGRVNIMAMDYGRKPASGQTVGDLAISAAQVTFKQLKAIWPKATDAETYHAIGITPMIGQNDGNSDGPFLVSDATKVASWAKQNGIGLLAYWAMQRDIAGSGDYNDHSNNQSSNYAYFKAFATAQQ